MSTQLGLVIAVGAIALTVLTLVAASFFTVEQRTTVIVQRLCKFLREAGPGLGRDSTSKSP